ncbi:MAG: hypothetical protein ACYCZH_14940 [Sulfuriferula sp.]
MNIVDLGLVCLIELEDSVCQRVHDHGVSYLCDDENDYEGDRICTPSCDPLKDRDRDTPGLVAAMGALHDERTDPSAFRMVKE